MRGRLKLMAEVIATESDLNRAVAKVAKERQLSTGEISALIHEVNHAANRHKLGAGENKAHAFDLADIDTVRTLLGPSKAAHATDHIKVAEKYMVRETRTPNPLAPVVHNTLINMEFEEFLKTAEQFVKSADSIKAEMDKALGELGHEFYCSGLSIDGLRTVMNAVKEAEDDEVFNNDWEPIIKALEKEYPIKTGRPTVISDNNWVKVHMSRIGRGISDFEYNSTAPRECIIAIRASMSKIKQWPKEARAIIEDAHTKLAQNSNTSYGPAGRNLILKFIQDYAKQVTGPLTDFGNRLL